MFFFKGAKWSKIRVTIGVLELPSQTKTSVQLGRFGRKTGASTSKKLLLLSLIREEPGFSKPLVRWIAPLLSPDRKRMFGIFPEVIGPWRRWFSQSQLSLLMRHGFRCYKPKKTSKEWRLKQEARPIKAKTR